MTWDWVQSKWPRRLLLPPIALMMIGFGAFWAVTAVDAGMDGIRLAGARSCNGTGTRTCIYERPAVVTGDRVERSRRGPDRYFVTLEFDGGGAQDVEIAYESEWREHEVGERVTLRTLGERPLEVVGDTGVSARAAAHPAYRGIKRAIEAPFFALGGAALMFALRLLERRDRGEEHPYLVDLPRRAIAPLAALFAIGAMSFTFNPRPLTLALIAAATLLTAAFWPRRRQRSRMKP